MQPLMLLPGLMNDRRVWDALQSRLAGRRHVVVVDTHINESMTKLASDAINAMPRGRFAVAGFSLGGYVALEVCAQTRERVAGTALLGTGARADAKEATLSRQLMLDALGSGTASLAEVARGFASRVFHPVKARDLTLLALLSDMAQTVGTEGFARQQRAAMNRRDHRKILATLHCPALVLCGANDRVTPPNISQEMASLLPGDVDLVLVESCGHMATLEQSATVDAAIGRWLARCDAAHRDGEQAASDVPCPKQHRQVSFSRRRRESFKSIPLHPLCHLCP